MNRILIIEDDESIAEIEKDYLTLSGFSVDIEADGRRGFDAALKGEHDLIILDVMLPSMNGFEILQEIRSKILVPILVVTAKVADLDKIRGLGFGADDYIEKPFSPSVLVAKVKAHLKQYTRLTQNEPSKRGLIEIGSIRLNTQTHQVFKDDKEVILKNKEYALLSFLMLNYHHVYSKEELYEAVWGMEAMGDNATVAVHMNRLREKLEDDSANPVHLVTIWGAGYCFK